jgi:SLT domain-containing protein
MGVMTFVAACALVFRAELFVPIVTHDGCTTSAAVGTASIPRNTRPNTGRWTTYIAEAAQRFGRPEAWVRAVMQAESGGAADATSPAGAIGLMQIMPETYAELRVRYGLGANAYDPHDNIIAGTAYMSEMIELFGVPNFLAAYNAGPARFDDYLQRGRLLPDETRRYLARIGELPPIALASGDMPAVQSAPVLSAPSNAPSSSRATNSGSVSALPTIGASADAGQHRQRHEIAGPSGLFAQRSSTPPATPSPFSRQPGDAQGGVGGALFVPLGRDPVRVSANFPSRRP